MVKATNAFNIADFRAVLDTGVQRPNKFRVRIYMPAGLFGTAHAQEFGLANDDFTTVRYLEYYAAGCQIPTMGIQTHAALRYGYGASEKRPYAPNYMDCTVNFIAEAHGSSWKFFNNWMNLIYNTRMQAGIDAPTGHVNMNGGVAPSPGFLVYGPYELSYKVEYLTELEIHTMTQTGEIDKVIVLREAFPIAMGPAEMDWGRNNSITTLPILFTFTDAQMYFGDQLSDG